MHSSLKLSAAVLINFAFLCNEVFAQLPPINFDSYTPGTVIDLTSPDGWESIYGTSSVTPAGQGFGGTGQALKIGVDPQEEAWLRKPVTWNPAEKIAFIDFRIKPAATPEGSQANFLANGTQLAFQLRAGSTTGQLWVLHGNDNAVPVPPATTIPEEKWYLSAGSFTVPANSPVSTTWLRATLRHDYLRNIWDLFIDGKLAAVNLGFEGRVENQNLTDLEFFGSLKGDTLIDNLEANPSNMLFPDADKDGLPDAWEIANGSNPNLYDREALKPGTNKSFLDHYLDSLWNVSTPGTPVNGANGTGNVGTVPPLTILESHQPVGALKGQFAVGGDGAATYTMPLDVPKGRAGMEPKLSLNYSSNGGNGPMGVGWSIGGLQKITRGPSSLKKDGIADGADFDANDRYFLDGERLVCVSTGINPTTNQPYKYGEHDTEYRTEMDSYARIKAVGQMVENTPDGPINLGPAYWTVETKSGLKVTLGDSTSSKVQVDSYRILSWLVNQVADTTGRNAYAVDYCDNAEALAATTASGRYPWKVRYTIDPTVSGDQGFCSVNFDYGTRADVNSGYIRGVKQEANLRLERINVKTGDYLNHAYTFFYTTSEQTRRSLLTGVGKVAADGSSVPPTAFQWQTLSHTAPKWVEAGHLDFNEYGSGQDSGSSMASFVSVSESDSTEIHLTGNAWRTYPLSTGPLDPGYTVTANTWLQFDYKTTAIEPKWGMIGVDENTSTSSPKRLFKLVGGALPPVSAYSDNAWKYTSPGNWQTIKIPVGQNYTGLMAYLALVNDDNTANDGVGESKFRNIRFFEENPGTNSVPTRTVTFDQAIASPRIIDGNNEDLGVRIQDMNGDGLPDIAYNLLFGKTSGTGAVTLQTFGQALRNTGSEFVNDTTLKLPPTVPTGNLPGAGEGQFANSQAIYPVPVDINGDGQLDYAFAKNLTRESDGTFTCEHGYLTRQNNAWVELTAYAHHFKSNCATSQKRFSHFEHLDLDSDGDLDLLVHPYGANLALLPGKPNTSPLSSFPITGASGSNVGVAYLNKFHEGLGWVGSSDWRLPVPLRIPGFNNNGGEVGRSIQDLNGDGRPDLYSALWQANKNVWLNKDTADGWDAKDSGSIHQIPENLTNSNGDDVGTRLVDVNGDGRVDALKALGSGSMDMAKGVHLNTGNGWVSQTAAPIPWLPQENFNTLDKRGEVQEQGTSFADLNADGLVDFVVSKPSRDTVFLNTGSGWSAEDQTSQPQGYQAWKLPSPIYPNTTASTSGIRHAMLVDLNGDGVSDLIGDMKSPVPRIWINQAAPERIISFTDGFAAQIQVNDYRLLNDPTPVPNSLGLNRRVYDRTPVSDDDSNTTWDAFLPGHVSLCDSRWVVARYSESDGMGGRRHRSHYYRDLRYDKTNEASLGFGEIEVRDEVTRGYTVTTTRRDYPYAGSAHLTRSHAFVGAAPAGESHPLPAQPGIAANSYHLVSEESAGYAQLPSAAGIGSINGAQHYVYRPVQTVSMASKFELGDPVNPVSRVTTTQNLADFDSFGFVRKSTVTALDNSTTTTESAYWHGTGNKWLLGRLAASRVTKSRGGISTVKTSGFAYRTSDGLLVKEVVEPEGLPPTFAAGTALSTYDPVPAEPTPITAPNGGHPGGVEKSYGLDGFGNTVSESVTAYFKRETGPSNRRTRVKETEWGYNGRFPVREDTIGLGGTNDALHTYNSDRALLVSSTDIDGRVTSFGYDSFGTQIATHLPDGTSSAEITRYAANGHLPPSVVAATAGATLRWVRRAQASGTPWATVYFDSLGREIVTEELVLVSLAANGTPTFENQYVVTCYDARGRNYRSSNPFFARDTIHWILLHHDALDRVYKTTRPDTSMEGLLSIGVENPGTNNPLSKVVTYDAKGSQLQRWTDQHGLMVKSSDGSTQVTTFTHDPEGRVTAATIGSDVQLTNHFDKIGNKWQVTDLSGGTSTSVTNGFGEVISATSPLGTISTTHDALGRVEFVAKPEGTYQTHYNGSSPALGSPDKVTGPSGYLEDFTYGPDAGVPYEYGKLVKVEKRESSTAPPYISRTAYNALGLVMDEWFDGEFNTTTPGDATPDDDAQVRHEYDPVFGTFELRTKLYRGLHQTLLSQVGGISISSNGNELTTSAWLAHNVQRRITTDLRNGRIRRIESDQGSVELQRLTYEWDNVGNLLSRQDMKAGKTEVFEYDSLHRLEKSTINSQPSVLYTYDNKGNLKTKAGSPPRTYDGYRVEEAVVKGQIRFHKYGAGGYLDEVRETNATGTLLRDTDWTSFGQLKQVSQTSTPALRTFDATQTYAADGVPGIASWEIYQASQALAQFDFDASGSRSKQVLTRTFALGSEKRCITRYLGTYENEIHETKPVGGSYTTDRTLHRHRLGNALLTTEKVGTSAPLTRLAVVLTDHIGSTDVTVRGEWNGNGWNLGNNQQQAERQSFDAWGGRRDQTAWTDLHPASNSTRQTSAVDQDRGFTGHEMLDDFGIVHMNGRIYDSDLGRFLSPDPYVQVPEYSQNFNRYSYVLNNPLSMTDPSGHLIHGLHAAAHIAGFLEAREGTRNYLAKHPDVAQAVTIVVAVVLFVVTGGAAAAGYGSFAGLGNGFAAAVVTGAGTGGFSASAAGGDLGDVIRGAAVGAASAAVTAGILGPLDHATTGWAAGIDPAARAVMHIAGHGIVGGLSNEAMGGRFQDGFLSGLAGALASHVGLYDILKDVGGPAGVIARTAMAGIIGGTASAIGGGKFANGAFTAAFQHLLNSESGRGGLRSLLPEWMPGSYEYPISQYVGEVQDVFIGEAKGAAENVSFGVYQPTYKNDLQRVGGKIGDTAVTAFEIGTGAGALKAGARQATKVAGKEFSHWVPARVIKSFPNRITKWFDRSMLNGNMVSPMRHFKHDPFRFPKGWRDMGPRLKPFMRQLDRIPDSIKTAAAGFGTAAGSHAARAD